MCTITIKHVPDDLYESLKQRAAQNRRSINSEIIACSERAVHRHKVQTSVEILVKAREFRTKTCPEHRGDSLHTIAGKEGN
jgi:plasmid stability protein